ncbi:MAG: acyl-CoA thioesterase [Planctomycetota bacterium]|nr:acyl-CoA thioesterase [Planctomycetota bacterium]
MATASDSSCETKYHETEARVRYAETDRMGFAYYAHFFVWFEVGRTAFLRDRGYPYTRFEEEGYRLPVVEAGARYHAPARYDDVLKIQTRVAEVRISRIRFENRVLRASDGKLLAEGEVTLACVDASGRPARIPEGIRRLLLG